MINGKNINGTNNNPVKKYNDFVHIKILPIAIVKMVIVFVIFFI